MKRQAIPGTGRKLKTTKFMIRLAIADLNHLPVPIFESNRLNRYIYIDLVDKLRKQRSHVRGRNN